LRQRGLPELQYRFHGDGGQVRFLRHHLRVVAEPLAALFPSVFQRTPDTSTAGATGGRAVPQQPNVNAPLLARLELPDGRVHAWSIDPRTVAWAPTKVPLNLPKFFKGRGRVTLTLSTVATNGGYGVAVGEPGALLNGHYSHGTSGVVTAVPRAEMLLQTSHKPADAPKVTMQPAGVRVAAGTAIGFLVKAEGVGLGYQWYRNGPSSRPMATTNRRPRRCG
jgi:hypothetical protein